VKSERIYLDHILVCIEKVRRAASIGRDAFLKSELHQDAILRNLQTLAESTQKLSPRSRSLRPEIDWRAVAGFRNVLVHDYLGVDLEQAWRIIHDDQPPLETAVRSILASLPPAD